MKSKNQTHSYHSNTCINKHSPTRDPDWFQLGICQCSVETWGLRHGTWSASVMQSISEKQSLPCLLCLKALKEQAMAHPILSVGNVLATPLVTSEMLRLEAHFQTHQSKHSASPRLLHRLLKVHLPPLWLCLLPPSPRHVSPMDGSMLTWMLYCETERTGQAGKAEMKIRGRDVTKAAALVFSSPSLSNCDISTGHACAPPERPFSERHLP